MKKRLFAAFTAVLLLACLTAPAYAAGLDYVSDTAGLLTEAEASELNAMAKEISERQQCGVYIITVPDYRSVYNGDIEECAERLYKHYDLGYGEGRDGTLLLLSTSTREYDHSAYGYGNTAFTDYGKDVLADSYLTYLGRDDWYGGFKAFLTGSDKLLATAREGNAFDVAPSGYVSYGPSGAQILLMVVILPCFIALMVCLGFKKSMVSAVKQTGAREYIDASGTELRINQDSFINRTQTRRIIETQSRSSGGGFHGGTTVNSHGFSHHSGKF